MKTNTESSETSDAVTILDRMAAGNPQLQKLSEEARINAARTKAGLSQAELAGKIGTKQSVISRLEDADYNGHSLNILNRIATALGQRLDIRFRSPVETRRAPKSDPIKFKTELTV